MVCEKIISLEEARTKGLKYFFTGKPCKHGHTYKRLVANRNCVLCTKFGTQKWRSKNREHIADFSRAYWAANKDRISSCRTSRYKSDSDFRDRNIAVTRNWRANNLEFARQGCRDWRANNLELALQRCRDYYYKNKDSIASKSREWRAENIEIVRKKSRELARKRREVNPEKEREISREWRNSNPDKVRVYRHNRRARKLSAGGNHTSSDIKEILKQQRGKCAYFRICKTFIRNGNYHVDHIVPLCPKNVSGGTNFRSNLQLTCPRCNLQKNAKDPIVFAQQLGMLL